MKKLTIVALVAMLLLTAALPANAQIQATSVEIRGTVAEGTGTHIWNNASFAGFFYDIDDGLGTETLTANVTGTNAILEDNLIYTTTGQPKMLKVIDAKYRTNPALAADDGLEEFGAGDSAEQAGNFTIIGWMAEKYVAIKEKPNKLGKLLIEHGTSSSEKKTLTVGETWELGGGYTMTANSIDAKASPRQVWLTLSRDGVKKDDKVVTSGQTGSDPIYTYVEKSLCGETDVPILVTYVDSVFAGATTDMVQFRYTWLMNPSCTEVKSSDVFGSMKVSSTDPLRLQNSDTSMTLSRDSTVDIMGDIKFKVADSDALRFYPFVLKTQPGTYEVRGAVAEGTGTRTWNNASFAGFFYDIDDGLGTETLTANVTGTNAILEDNLIYTTTGQPKMLKVIDAKYRTNPALAADDGLEEFGAGDSAEQAGNFTIIGWMAEKYVAIKKKPNKLGKLLIEHGTSSSEKKTLTVGETWELGGGYTMTANSIDAKASPRQVWLTLNRDGVKKDDKVVTSGAQGSDPIYTYVEKSLCGETDVPILVTYVDSVFAGATTDMVQFRYTWLMNPSCTEVKSSDVFGSMKVSSTDPLRLQNSDTSMTLSRDSTVDIMGGMKFRVADSDALRYYPMVEYVIGETGETTGTPTVTANVTVTTPPAGNVTVTTPPVETTTAVETTKPPVATTTKTEPGFEAVFAIAGLLAVAFLVLRQRK